MSATKQTIDNQDVVLQSSLAFMKAEEAKLAKTLVSTGMVGSNPTIDTKTETFAGQLKWDNPLNFNINVLTTTDPTEGVVTNSSQDFLTYIKTARSVGTKAVNVAELITNISSLEKISAKFSEAELQDEGNALSAILRGVATTEALTGAKVGGLGGQTFGSEPTSANYGFFVDLGAATPVVEPSVGVQGAARATNFLNALSAAFKDYEPEYAYLAISPKTFASFRSANLVDDIGIVDGNVTFNTIFNGKFRLFVTRTNLSFTTAELAAINGGGGLNIVGTEASFIIMPGAFESEKLIMPLPVEVTRNGAAYQGGGTTSIWSRWGRVMQPAGYSWAGSQDVFASDADYKSVIKGGVQVALSSLTGADADTVVPVWTRKVKSVLNLGILPVFHG